jgi:nucleoside-diphosphate-sugar epimerase
MAKMVAEKLADKPIQVVFDIPEDNAFGYAKDTKLRLSAKKLRTLGWEPKVGLEEAYRRMMGSMRQEKLD